MSDAHFFKGTSTDQDNRFSNKTKKLMKTMKFPENLDKKVDMTKVNLDTLKPWITKKITQLLTIEDDVIIEFVFNQLDARYPDGKEMQINLTGFLNAKNARAFMEELWNLILSAMENVGGIPAVFLEQKKDEIKKRQLEQEKTKESEKPAARDRSRSKSPGRRRRSPSKDKRSTNTDKNSKDIKSSIKVSDKKDASSSDETKPKEDKLDSTPLVPISEIKLPGENIIKTNDVNNAAPQSDLNDTNAKSSLEIADGTEKSAASNKVLPDHKGRDAEKRSSRGSSRSSSSPSGRSRSHSSKRRCRSTSRKRRSLSRRRSSSFRSRRRRSSSWRPRSRRRFRSRPRSRSHRRSPRRRSPRRRSRSLIRRRSPRRRTRSPIRRSRSPIRRSRSPNKRSRSPIRRSRSPVRRSPVRRMRSPFGRSYKRHMESPRRFHKSPLKKVRGRSGSSQSPQQKKPVVPRGSSSDVNRSQSSPDVEGGYRRRRMNREIGADVKPVMGRDRSSSSSSSPSPKISSVRNTERLPGKFIEKRKHESSSPSPQRIKRKFEREDSRRSNEATKRGYRDRGMVERRKEARHSQREEHRKVPMMQNIVRHRARSTSSSASSDDADLIKNKLEKERQMRKEGVIKRKQSSSSEERNHSRERPSNKIQRPGKELPVTSKKMSQRKRDESSSPEMHRNKPNLKRKESSSPENRRPETKSHSQQKAYQRQIVRRSNERSLSEYSEDEQSKRRDVVEEKRKVTTSRKKPEGRRSETSDEETESYKKRQPAKIRKISEDEHADIKQKPKSVHETSIIEKYPQVARSPVARKVAVVPPLKSKQHVEMNSESDDDGSAKRKRLSKHGQGHFSDEYDRKIPKNLEQKSRDGERHRDRQSTSPKPTPSTKCEEKHNKKKRDEDGEEHQKVIKKSKQDEAEEDEECSDEEEHAKKRKDKKHGKKHKKHKKHKRKHHRSRGDDNDEEDEAEDDEDEEKKPHNLDKLELELRERALRSLKDAKMSSKRSA